MILRLALLFFIIGNVSAREVPALTGPVVDDAGLLSSRFKAQLSHALYQIKEKTKAEIAILTVESLEDESLEGFSIKVTDKWQLGDKETDQGLLLLVAVNERKIRIEVGQGLEGILPDALSARIITKMKPYFKRKDYQSGIVLAVSEIATLVGAPLKDAPPVKNRRSGKKRSSLLFFVILILSFLFGGRGRGGGLLGMLLLGSAMGGGRSSYSSGGGGFSSGGGSFGGGGGFSGGGASGDW
jgi:uncharacterized protein